jgi:hypothetical protein
VVGEQPQWAALALLNSPLPKSAQKTKASPAAGSSIPTFPRPSVHHPVALALLADPPPQPSVIHPVGRAVGEVDAAVVVAERFIESPDLINEGAAHGEDFRLQFEHRDEDAPGEQVERARDVARALRLVV